MAEALSARPGGGPVRGTQSFVGGMSAVWRRPSLTGRERLWRWVTGALLLGVAAVAFGAQGFAAHVDAASLQALTVFQPATALRGLQQQVNVLVVAAMPVLRWLFPVGVAVWLVAAAMGRTLVLRRLDGRLRARPGTLLVLGTLRAVLLGAAWVLWGWCVAVAGRVAIAEPTARRAEPNLVLYFAILICGSLLLYVVWAVASWFLQLAPLLAMERNVGAMGSLSGYGSPLPSYSAPFCS